MNVGRLLAGYSHLDSPVHRWPAGVKLGLALAVLGSLAFLPPGSLGWTSLALVLLTGVAVLARVPLSVFVIRLLAVQPFVLGVAVLALLQGRGLVVFAGLAVKASACVAVLQLLTLTTPFLSLLDVLRRLRFPPALVLTLAFLHRYLAVLVSESERMRRARAARSWDVGRERSWVLLSSVIAGSFVRSLARAERIAAAMQARGWS